MPSVSYATCCICGEEWRVSKADEDNEEYTCDYCEGSEASVYDDSAPPESD